VLFNQMKSSQIKISMVSIEDLAQAPRLAVDALHHLGRYNARSSGDRIFAPFGARLRHKGHPPIVLYEVLLRQEDLRRYRDLPHGQQP
jgi:hypothetical protein